MLQPRVIYTLQRLYPCYKKRARPRTLQSCFTHRLGGSARNVQTLEVCRQSVVDISEFPQADVRRTKERRTKRMQTGCIVNVLLHHLRDATVP
jgi:hypothetical protein